MSGEHVTSQRPVLVARVVRDPEPVLASPPEVDEHGRRPRPGAGWLSRTRRLVSGLFATLLVGFLCTMGVSGGTQSANALSIPMPCFGEVEDAQGPYSTANGSALFEALNIAKGGEAYGDTPVTAYEMYGTAGLFWSEYRPKEADQNADGKKGCITSKWGSAMGNMIANEVMSVNTTVTRLTVSMYQWAADPDLLKGMTDPVDCIVKGCSGGKGLDDVLFLGFLRPIILMAALWAAWVGLFKKRTVEAAQGGLWMLGAATFALVFMTYPGAIAEQANGFVGEVNSTVMEGVASATTATVPENDICYLPAGAEQRGTRVASCSIYKAMSYTPWAAGQFGTTLSTPLPSTVPVQFGGQKRDDLRISQLEAQTISHDEIAGNVNDAVAEDHARWDAVREDIENDHAELFTMWSGDQASERVNIAFASVIAALCVGILVILISFSTVVLALGMMLLIIIAPVFLLIGVHPGFGRGIGLKWLELLIGTVFKRVILSLMLAVIIGMYQIVLQTPMAWFSQIALILAIGVGAIMYRKPLLETLNVVNLGGARSGLEQGGGQMGAKKAGGGAVGAVSGAAAAAGGGGAGAMLGGAIAGAMSGQRTGSVVRAGSVGAGAGRRVASRKNAKAEARKKEAEGDEPNEDTTGKNGPRGNRRGRGPNTGGDADAGPQHPPTPPTPTGGGPVPRPETRPAPAPAPAPLPRVVDPDAERERHAAERERQEAAAHRRTQTPRTAKTEAAAETAAEALEPGAGGRSPLEQRLLDQARRAQQNGNGTSPTPPAAGGDGAVPRPDGK